MNPMKAQTTTWATKPEMIIATSACRPRTKHRSHDAQKDLVREVFIFAAERLSAGTAVAAESVGSWVEVEV